MPVGGWVTSIAVLVSCVVIFVAFYYQRWKWISKWKFTTKHGIQCFFDDKTTLYLLKDVEDTTGEMFIRWDMYYEKFKSIPAQHTILNGLICLFVAPGVFEVLTPGYPMRLVYGVASGNFIKVGQGGKPIEQTAYMHECSHIHLNRVKGCEVPEEEAHEIFRTVGV